MRDQELELREVLQGLLHELNSYNQPDQLDGYLNGLAQGYNARLAELQLPLLSVVSQEDEE